MKEELVLTLNDKATPRNEFLVRVRDALVRFMGKHHNAFIMMIKEMVKNVWDHADGTGYVSIVRDPDDSYSFHVWDEGSQSYRWSDCLGKSRLAGNGTNCGLGLQSILDTKATLDMELQIDTHRGFEYAGTYRPRPTQEHAIA